MAFLPEKNIFDYPIVAFDTETSGAYPVESEIIELGAVKWLNGQVIDKFQTLLKPSELLKEDNIRIHGITNEMVAEAPKMSDKIADFCNFIEGTVLLAHHAPFDLGFLSIAIEEANLQFPKTLNICTSLLSRALLITTNHKLQTLIKELKLEGGAAHRAYDDAYACLQVFQKCAEKYNGQPDNLDNQFNRFNINQVLGIQKKELGWNNYKVLSSGDEKLKFIFSSIRGQKKIGIVYSGGSAGSKIRYITPMGLVRNPDGDYINAYCHNDNQRKRFYIDKIVKFES